MKYINYFSAILHGAFVGFSIVVAFYAINEAANNDKLTELFIGLVAAYISMLLYVNNRFNQKKLSRESVLSNLERLVDEYSLFRSMFFNYLSCDFNDYALRNLKSSHVMSDGFEMKVKVIFNEEEFAKFFSKRKNKCDTEL